MKNTPSAIIIINNANIITITGTNPVMKNNPVINTIIKLTARNVSLNSPAVKFINNITVSAIKNKIMNQPPVKSRLNASTICNVLFELVMLVKL